MKASKFRKLLAIVLAGAMVMAMGVTSMAATITVSQNPGEAGTAGNESYVAYKIFDVSKTGDVTEDVTTDETIGDVPKDSTGFAYTIDANSAWVNILLSDKGKTYFTLTKSAEGDLYTVGLVEGNESEAKAKEIAAWLLEKKPATFTENVDMVYEFDTEDMAVKVDDGYYLITSSLGTNLILATSNVNISEKNQFIIDGKVAETASVTIGENVTYYIKVYLPSTIDTALPVVVHDALAKEFSFNNDVKVAVLDKDPGDTVAAYKAVTTYGDLPNAFVVGDGDEESNPCTFHITLKTTDYAGKYLLFKYTAELTSAADADGDGYVNKEFTTYSDYVTTPSEPKVKTYDFEFTKVDGNKAKLDGAEFELYAGWDATNNKATGDAIAFNALTGDNAGNYKKADTDDTSTVTTIKVDSKTNDGPTNISGLGGSESGTNYYLVETKAPDGFNMLTSPIVINVKDNGTITVSLNGVNLDSASDAFNVENQSGAVLPSTGGIGTTLFYTIGGLLVAGALITVVVRRRLKKEDN
jgi:fimbrial isopeptide formation D2 family protein/LPXTG-motif cell wall-anchored protein